MGMGGGMSEGNTGVMDGEGWKPPSMHRGDNADQGGEEGRPGDVKMETHGKKARRETAQACWLTDGEEGLKLGIQDAQDVAPA